MNDVGSFQRPDDVVEAAVQRAEIPGAVLHVRQGGRVVHHRAFGRRHSDQDASITPEDLFPVASLTKPVVAVGVLQLCEVGRIALDAPLATYLPGFANATVLVQYDVASGDLVTRPARRQPTVRHLLTHTAGIHDGFVSTDPVMGTLYERAGVVYDSRLLLEEKIKRLAPLPLTHDPGEAWTYGLSSDVGGRLIEVVSGKPLDQYLAATVFRPLGMQSTYFFVPPEGHPRTVGRHVRRNGKITPMPPDPHDGDDMRYLSGGGGLHTTAADYSRFTQALLDGGHPILSPASVEAMTTNQIGELRAFGFKYGLGLGIATAECPGQVPLPVGGYGWYGIYGTWFWTLPAQRTAVLLFSNILQSDMTLGLFAHVVRTVQKEGDTRIDVRLRS
jgi:CubicO group peptidase (beta-lactamase class C family)